MADPRRILLHGANGRMGRALQRLCACDADCHVVAAVSRKVAQRVVDGVPQFAAGELGGVPAFDVAIDFSQPDAFDAILALCVERGVPLVSGTTGLSDPQRAAVQDAGKRIALLWAANFSVGVAVLDELVERAAGVLQGWDCDILEAHHAQKKDAPSGTALMLGAAASIGGRTPHYASVRAGDIVGEHVVQFATAGERIELVHRATDRDVFARGALQAAKRLPGRAAGVYRLRDLL